MDEIHVEFQWERSEWTSAYRRLVLTRLFGATLLSSVILLVTGVIMEVLGNGGFILIFIGVGFFLYNGALAWFIVKRIWSRTESLRLPIKMSFSEEGVTAASSAIQSKINWSVYPKSKEWKSYFTLQRGRIPFVIIPKRAFSSIGDENSFRDLIQSKTNLRS